MRGQKQLIDERCSFSRKNAGAIGHQDKKKYYNLSVTCYTKSNKKCITGTSLCRGPGFKGSILGQGTRSHEDMGMKTWHRLKKINHRYKYKTI